MVGGRRGQVNGSDLRRCGDLGLTQLGALADFLNTRRDNRRAVFGMMKLQVHTVTNEVRLEHGTAPGRACDGYLNWMRTVLRMA